MSDIEKHIIREEKEESQWQILLNEMSHSTLYSSWGWGEYKRQKGWRVKRLAILDKSTSLPFAAVQIQQKKKPFTPKVVLVQGGPASLPETTATASDYLPSLIETLGLGKLDIAVFQPYQAITRELAIALMEKGFVESKPKGSYTFKLDLRKSSDEIISNMSHNWRHNLKRSGKKELGVRWVEFDYDKRMEAFARLSEMYDYLTTRKGFGKAIDPTSFAEAFAKDPNVEMLEIVYKGKVIAGRVGYQCNSHMLDVLAASTEEARNTYASYLALWSLIMRAKDNSSTYFDCGGIDPERNNGVFNFKKGLNGSLESSGSLWVYSPSSVVSRLFIMMQA